MRWIPGSLRLRLLAAVGILVVAAVTAVGWLSARVSRNEYVRLQLPGPLPAWVGPVGDGLARELRVRCAGSEFTTGLAGVIERHLRPRGREAAAVILGPDDRLLASVTPRPLAAARRTSESELILELEGPAAARRTRGLLRFRTPGLVIDDGRGNVCGRAYVLPWPEVGRTGEADFVWSVNRGVLFATVAAGIVALVAVVLLATRLMRPVQALTVAAERLGRGDLSARVSETGPDEIRRLALSFNRMADSLTRHEAIRRQMLNDVAHELRTPLTNIRCQLEAIEDGLLPPSPDVLASLDAELGSLAATVDDLQDLALADAGRLRIQAEPFDVAAELRLLVQALEPQRGPRLEVDVSPGLVALADRVRFRQILRNLVANAVAATPADGRITITARAADGLDEPSRPDRRGRSGGLTAGIEVSVTDTGAGIPPAELPFVFERFHRTDPARSRASGGAGLGLAIVKTLVEIHGGRVHASSTVGAGSQFVFTVPAGSTEKAPPG